MIKFKLRGAGELVLKVAHRARPTDPHGASPSWILKKDLPSRISGTAVFPPWRSCTLWYSRQYTARFLQVWSKH